MKDIKNYLAEIFTFIIIVGLIIYSFVGMGLKDRIDEGFWTSFAVNFSIMLLITSIWYPSAKQKAQCTDTGYINQRKYYATLVDKIVDTNNQKGLSKFCEYATEQNRICKLKQRLIKINVDYDVYLHYKDCPSSIYAEKDYIELSNKQKKALEKLIVNGVYVKNIDYSSIITGIKGSKNKYDTSSGERKYDVLKLSTKICISVFSSIFMAYIVFSMFGFTWESVARLTMWLIMIVWNIFTSYQAGYKSISIKRCDYYKKLKTFLEEFVSSEYFVNVSRETIKNVSQNNENVSHSLGVESEQKDNK